jgi:hypothetical protein
VECEPRGSPRSPESVGERWNDGHLHDDPPNEEQETVTSWTNPRQGYLLCDVPIVNVYLARERAQRGDRDEAIPVMRAASIICFATEGCCGRPFLRRVFWWRHCSTAGPTVTRPKPR